jgi:DNA-binding NarL/FixJ family response regulator
MREEIGSVAARLVTRNSIFVRFERMVDDNHAIRYRLRRIFDERPIFTSVPRQEMEAVEAADRIAPDAIILDLSMPVMNGLDAAEILQKSSPKTKVVLFSDHPTIFSARNA